jgi:hypothetical protein
MNDQDFRKLLEQLHHEIEQTKTVDAHGRELLRDLNSDIRELLERTEKSPIQSRPVTVQRLEDSISHLEATHPNLTTLLSKLLATLSNSGI